MKILLIMDAGIPVPPTFYGGIERQVYQLAEEYIALGHEVTLLAGPQSYCSGKTIAFGINQLARSKAQKSKEILFGWRFLQRNKNQFNLIHNFGRLIYLLPALTWPAVKIMSYQRQVFKKGIRIITSLPNKNLFFTACSNYCVGTGNVAGNWNSIYNAIDFSLYQLNKCVTADAPLIFLGRLDRIKGAHSAIAIAKATGQKLLIAGNISHTPDNYQYFKNEVEPHFDQEQIIYLGALNDIEKNKYLGQSKALLFPIEWDEPFGIVMAESMACGTPVIGFNRGAVPEVVMDGLTGYIVNSVQEMAEKIAALNDIDRAKCRETAEKRFNVNKITKQYLALCD